MKVIKYLLVITLVLPPVVRAQDRVRKLTPEQESLLEQEDPNRPLRRLALVIGNWNYQRDSLPNAKNDAADMARALRALDFHVFPFENVKSSDLDPVIDKFVSTAQRGDIAFVYYSGHGAQVEHHNYLIPVDFKGQSALQIMRSGYDFGLLHEKLALRGTRARILIIDACRNNPFGAGERGLAGMELGAGTLVEFAASSGHTADDNPSGRNGLFTQFVLKELKISGIGAEVLANSVRNDVYRASDGKQLPFVYSGLVGDLPLAPSPRVGLQVRVYMTAGSAFEKPRGALGDNSPFTAALVQTLQEGCKSDKLDALSLFHGVMGRNLWTPRPTYGFFGSVTGGASDYPIIPRQGKLRVLLIAGNHYDHWPTLDKSLDDAETLRTQLTNSCVKADSVVTLPDPTLHEILDALSSFSAMSYDPEDELLIFLSGHGFYDAKTHQSFIVARDSAAYGEDLFGTYLPAKQLGYLVDNIRAPRILLIFDALLGPPIIPVR